MEMIVFLNGEFVAEREARVSVFDRGFLYGDGLFEAVRIVNGKPFRWKEHFKRFNRGLEYLKIGAPYTQEALEVFAGELIRRNGAADCLLRLGISRGVGLRGYSPRGAENPTVTMSIHPIPSGDPGKMTQILARMEGDNANADEALLLNRDGQVIEGSSSNLFWLQAGEVCTPALANGILPGVTRAAVVEICERLGVAWTENAITPEQLRDCEGVFLSLSSAGVAEVVMLDGHPVRQSRVCQRIHDAYLDLMREETR
jgi:branched-subunit amino acid aminotransferase/4-amino-4-deoxychorismate lyase